MTKKEEYDKRKHVGREAHRDPLNGKLYVEHSIEWFIKKGNPISIDEPIKRNFVGKLNLGNDRTHRIIPTKIVVSYADKAHLPDHLGGQAQKLCEIESNLSSADERAFKEKNSGFWRKNLGSGKPYLQIEYQFRVLTGAADIRFELCKSRLPGFGAHTDEVNTRLDGQKISKDEPITVQWAPEVVPNFEPVLVNAAVKDRKSKIRSLFVREKEVISDDFV